MSQEGLLDARQAFFPDLEKKHGGLDIPQAVFGDIAKAFLADEFGDIHSGDALAFWRLEAEGLAVEIEVEFAGGSFAAADAVEGQLFSEIAVGFGLESIAEPVSAGDINFEQCGAEVNEGNIETAAVECHDLVVVSGHIPEGGQQLGLIDTRHEFDGTGVIGFIFEIIGREEDLASGGIGIEHGEADHLGGERPETELAMDLLAFKLALGFVGEFAGLAEEVFLLDIIECLEGKCRGFYIEHEGCHGLEYGA